MKLKDLVEKRARAVAEMRAYHEKGDDAKFNEINTEVELLDRQIEQVKQVEAAEKVQSAFNETKQPPMLDIDPAKVDAVQSGSAKIAMASDPEYAKSFSGFLRNGIAGIGAEDQSRLIRAAQTITTSGGGYLIPQGFSGMLEEALKFYGGILGVCSEFSTETGNPLPWPTVNDSSNKGRILGINVQTTETDFVFGQVMFGAFVGCSDAVLVPIQLMQDAYFNLDAEIAKMLGTRIGRLMNTKLTVGAGTTEPLGLIPAAVAQGLTYTTASGQTTTIVGDDLIELEHKVDPAYRPQSKYMFNDSTLKAIKKLKDSYNRYLWLPGLAASDPNTINGYPYVINNDMASLGTAGSPVTGNDFAAFGDFTKYKVRRVAGEITVQRLVERYADYLQIGYQAFVRFDGQLLDAGTHPVAVAVQAAS